MFAVFKSNFIYKNKIALKRKFQVLTGLLKKGPTLKTDFWLLKMNSNTIFDF